ncbi:MAG: hypothetical protein A2252_01870 [Elusimicrobia bacterium RIFOXYA2_FULL_39_19]|nr:MAG: hypothetical protein A2252_01870 [Elusimicrobia bacterium RIFOXYA2_FULL_39_19]
MNFIKEFYKKRRTLFFLIIIILVLTLNKGFFNLVSKALEYQKIKKELSAIRLDNARLKNEIYMLENDNAYIEYRIRKDLGYVKEGEVEYRYNK